MKLSANTIQVLKNFAQINPSIIFKPGNVIRTISPTKTIFATATVEETFESSFAIYELSKFLSVLSLFNDPELIIKDTHVTIKSGTKKLNYTFASTSVIVAPPTKNIDLPSIDAEFELSNETLVDAQKGASVLKLPEIAFVGDGSKVTIQAIDQKNSSGDNYQIDVGESEKTFKAIFKQENINFLPGAYNVTISKKGISHFKSEKIEYFVAVESTSQFDS